MGTNLASLLTDTAERHGERTALKLDDTEVSYDFLNEGSARVVGILKDHGFEAGDRVGIMLPNVPYFAFIYYGILRAGGIVVPMNPLLKGREVKFYLEDPGAKIMFAWHDFVDEAEKGANEAGADLISVVPGEFENLVQHADPVYDLADVDGDDTAVLLYTSGTTGSPKGAELTHSNLKQNVEVTLKSLVKLSEEDTLLGALPLFHSFGQTCGLNCGVAAGARLSLIPRFDPDKALEIIERDGVTIFQGVPTMYTAMLNSDKKDDFDVSCLRVCMSGGSAMPGEIMRSFEQQFGCKVLEGYGLSETSPVVCVNRIDIPGFTGTVGYPMPSTDVSVRSADGDALPAGEAGELCVRGPQVMDGYWRRPDETARVITPDGFLRTGDVAVLLPDGQVRIVDRIKDMVLVSGFNVYPNEVEDVLVGHPGVLEAAVIGVPDEQAGEAVVAFVVRRDPSLTVAALREHARGQLTGYKVPRRIEFRDSLPKTNVGKVLRRALREEAST